ncbi:MAG: T9SS type A sorting domain-containing protein [Candidatus Marinimicrobia bacterium]|nr:T9SS type A sorting domain-containing protein [Candidatus Neomarinimicrobiota bacterium]
MRFSVLFLLVLSTLWAQEVAAHKCGFAVQRGERMAAKSVSDRNFDYLDESILSPSGNFRIHFTRTGVHAVSGSSVIGTPLFIQEASIAADSAYNLLVNELGFLPPLPDGGVDGSELDIYVVDMKTNWGSIYYGMTSFNPTYSEPYTGQATYLEVDNDYIESAYATSGLEALRVTIAHEFFHMIQLRYAFPFAPVSSNAYWYEISSTWFEEKCYPEINDYHAYVADNFSQSAFPNLNDDSRSFLYSYGHGLFGQVLDQEYGIKNGKHIMLSIWEHLNTREATDNLAQVLSASPWGSSLTDALGKYALYNVFTGTRALPSRYYNDAGQLPEIRTSDYILPNDYPTPYDFELESMQMDFKRFSTQTLSNFYLWGSDLTQDQRVYLTYHSFDNGSSLKSPVVNDVWINCDSTNSQDYLILPMVNGDRNSTVGFRLTFGGSTLTLNNRIQTLWPNPVVLRNDPVHLNLMLGSPGMLELKVYNLRGEIIYQKEQFSPEGIRIIDLELPESTSSGIYFIQLISGDSVLSRKFTILK